jgi:excisionase family DNA binding protein
VVLDQIAEAVERRLAGRADSESPWLTTKEAASYLRCGVNRIKKLSATRDLPVEKDGSRNLYHRDRLDEYIRNGGAISP